MEQLLEMGMDKGLQLAMAQIDDVVADLTSLATGSGTTLQIVDDTHVRVGRIIRGSITQVWQAHQEPELMRRWMLGPDGWTMPVCEVATEVGDTYHYEWADGNGENSFGFTGELLASAHPYRTKSTEEMVASTPPSSTR